MTAGFTARLSAEIERDLRELSVRYAGACDRRDTLGLRELFTEDATVIAHLAGDVRPTVLRGRDRIGLIPGALTKYVKTFHILGQSAYADGDTDGWATGEVYCVAHHLLRTDAMTDLAMYVRYHDEYRSDAYGWQIVRREVFVDFTMTMPITWFSTGQQALRGTHLP